MQENVYIIRNRRIDSTDLQIIRQFIKIHWLWDDSLFSVSFVSIVISAKPIVFSMPRHAGHFCANLGYEVAVIQLILRHKSPSTTEGYLRSLGLERARAALESLPKEKAEVIVLAESESKIKN